MLAIGPGRSLVPARRTLVVFGVLVASFAQYFLRQVLAGLGVPGVENAVPFVVLDRLVGALNAPVYWLLGFVYDPWAPDAVAALALLAYYAALAFAASALLARLDQ